MLFSCSLDDYFIQYNIVITHITSYTWISRFVVALIGSQNHTGIESKLNVWLVTRIVKAPLKKRLAA